METLLTIVHIFVAFVLIIAVLLQAGKGGGMGATFGGASQEIFGGRGAGNFLTKITTLAAVIFFMTSLSLSMMSSQNTSAVGDALKTEAEAEAAAAVEVKAEEAPKADTNAEAVKAEEAPAEEVKAEEAPAADANAEAV
ncbi:preprotein translocase subunit SecG, partial [Myxococcota bacterium]|nr:preprotein translocase subunit SecG [Myxococcota bacterium]